MSSEVAFEVGRLYTPLKQIADLIVTQTKEIYIDLPLLRAWWPMTTINSNGDALSYTGDTAIRLNNVNVEYGFGSHGYVTVGPPGSYLRALSDDVCRISGVNGWVADDVLGLTVGAWAYMTGTPNNIKGICGRWAASGQRSYALAVKANTEIIWQVTDDGATELTVTGSEMPLNDWTFIVGRLAIPTRTFPQDCTLTLFINSGRFDETISMTGSIPFSTARFEVGRYRELVARIFEGRVRDVFVTECALSDETINELYLSSRP